jgi:DNA invertase Pin-like site-specific DNA recombinase
VSQLLGIFAEFERNLLIDRVTAGFERKASRGEWLSGPRRRGRRVCLDERPDYGISSVLSGSVLANA